MSRSSALRKEGLDDLLEMILLVAEMQDLKANPYRLAKGTIVEAHLDRGRGPVATVLVQHGTLRVGRPRRRWTRPWKGPGHVQCNGRTG